jgi:GTP-sensing pleiotropic transcriptional regulator CodY
MKDCVRGMRAVPISKEKEQKKRSYTILPIAVAILVIGAIVLWRSS